MTNVPSDKTQIDVYLYFDKIYVLITVAFIVVLNLVPSEWYWVIFAIYVAVMILMYLYRNKIVDFSSLFSTTAKEDSHSPLVQPEVFHVANQRFNYENAQAVCKAYDARLATYKEMEEAYKKGADWCTYGWSEGQNAFFPTQQSTFDQLQTNKGHEHDCGRPGINGGYVAEPNFEFGVNCYGKKPLMTDADKILMDATTPYPKNEQDIKLEQQVNYWKNNLNQLLISPFNKTTWDEPFVRV